MIRPSMLLAGWMITAVVLAGGSCPAGSPGPADSGATDAGRLDAGSPDAGPPDAGDCDGGCGMYRLCCEGECINPANDPEHCGQCGVQCNGDTPFCNSTCLPTPCSDGGAEACAADGGMCCGGTCCGPGQLCCEDEGPVSGAAACYTPTAETPTCPAGCAPLCISDRDAKRDITPVDDRAVLQALLRTPVSTWSYKQDPAGVRHIGPMAQDFHEAFGVGATDKAYDPIDAHGVAFSSIRALYGLLQEQDARLRKLEEENARLRKRLGPGVK